MLKENSTWSSVATCYYRPSRLIFEIFRIILGCSERSQPRFWQQSQKRSWFNPGFSRVHRWITRPVGSLGTVFDHQARFFRPGCTDGCTWLYLASLWFGVKNMVQHKPWIRGVGICLRYEKKSFWPMDWQENLFGPREAGFFGGGEW